MNSCTCKTERERAERLLNNWDDAKNDYRDALNELADLQLDLEALTSRMVRIGCAFASFIHIAIAVVCLDLFVKSLIVEDDIAKQKPIVEEKKKYRDKAKHYYDIAKERYMACKDSLKPCKGCEEEFKPKPECIKMCKGCEEDYCNGCFDAGIEAWEMKQKEKENV